MVTETPYRSAHLREINENRRGHSGWPGVKAPARAQPALSFPSLAESRDSVERLFSTAAIIAYHPRCALLILHRLVPLPIHFRDNSNRRRRCSQGMIHHSRLYKTCGIGHGDGDTATGIGPRVGFAADEGAAVSRAWAGWLHGLSVLLTVRPDFNCYPRVHSPRHVDDGQGGVMVEPSRP